MSRLTDTFKFVRRIMAITSRNPEITYILESDYLINLCENMSYF